MKIQTQDTHDRRRQQSERDVDNMENLVEAANNHRFDEVDNVENNYDMNRFDGFDVPSQIVNENIERVNDVPMTPVANNNNFNSNDSIEINHSC